MCNTPFTFQAAPWSSWQGSSVLTHPDLVLTRALLMRYLPHRFSSHLLNLTINPSAARDLGSPPLLKPPFVVQSSLGARLKGSKSPLMIKPRATDFGVATSRQVVSPALPACHLGLWWPQPLLPPVSPTALILLLIFKKIQNTLRTSANPPLVTNNLHHSTSIFWMTALSRDLLQVLWIKTTGHSSMLPACALANVADVAKTQQRVAATNPTKWPGTRRVRMLCMRTDSGVMTGSRGGGR